MPSGSFFPLDANSIRQSRSLPRFAGLRKDLLVNPLGRFALKEKEIRGREKERNNGEGI
jgi:hypothetical protein